MSDIQLLKLKGFNQVELTPQASQELIKRLIDFGLYPGVEFEIVKTLSLSNVTVIRFHQTLLALNEQEFKCLMH
jgi:Fe2+ transport system protein FeoA